MVFLLTDFIGAYLVPLIFGVVTTTVFLRLLEELDEESDDDPLLLELESDELELDPDELDPDELDELELHEVELGEAARCGVESPKGLSSSVGGVGC